jgi:plastocyanin
MTRKFLTGMIVIFLGVLCTVGTTTAEEKKAAPEGKQEGIKVTNKIVTLNEFEGASPATLISKSGTTVIWVNHSRSPVEILFLDKKVVLACGSPVNFFVGKDGAYESAKIPFGGTASLCFTEKGRYDYIIRVSRTFYQHDIVRDNRGTILIE